MICIKNKQLEKLNTNSLANLAHNVMNQIILLQRQIGFHFERELLKEEHISKETLINVFKIISNLADSIHNLPNAIKYNERENLIFELTMAINYLEDIENIRFLSWTFAPALSNIRAELIKYKLTPQSKYTYFKDGNP